MSPKAWFIVTFRQFVRFRKGFDLSIKKLIDDFTSTTLSERTLIKKRKVYGII